MDADKDLNGLRRRIAALTEEARKNEDAWQRSHALPKGASCTGRWQPAHCLPRDGGVALPRS